MRTPESRVVEFADKTIESFLTFGLLFMVAARTQPHSVVLEDLGEVSTVIGLVIIASKLP
jgi:hypothetical protein